MKIISNLYDNYNDILEKYNQITEKPLAFQDLISEAVQNALQNADWTQLKHFKYKQNINQDGYFWKPVFYRFDYESFIQIRQYLRDNIEIDDIVNFSLLFSKKFLLLKLKKEIIDKTWDIKTIVKVFKSKGYEIINVSDNTVKIDICPICAHEDFVVFINEDSLPHGNCFRCGFTKDIWALLGEISDFADNIEDVWEIRETLQETEAEIQYHMMSKTQKGFTNEKNIEKILQESKRKCLYMQKLGFSIAELEECDIYYRDASESDCNESNDFRYRVIYAIRDKNGKVVGLQGRSIFDDEQEREHKVLSDSVWEKLYWKNDRLTEEQKENKKKKLTAKVVNTVGFCKDENLYLLYKYTKNPSNYKKVVIVEGPKDAARVFCRHLPGIAVVATLGNSISQRQMELLAEVFGKDIEICLAYDATEDGVKANILAWKKLKSFGFEKVRFVIYAAKDKKGNLWKDFGEMIAPSTNLGYYTKLTAQIAVMLNRLVVSPGLYVREMQKKLGIIFADKEIREVLRQEINNDAKQHFEELYKRCAEELMSKTASNL